MRRVKYDCGSNGPRVWSELPLSCDSYPFNYAPDNLFLDENRFLCYRSYYEPIPKRIVPIAGSDSLSLSDSSFSVDSTNSLAKYHDNRWHLMRQLESLSKETNAMRIQLFSSRMLNHFVGRVTIADEEIQLMNDLVVDILDEAFEDKKFVMLCMWNHPEVDFDQAMVDLYTQQYGISVHVNRFQGGCSIIA